jgi:hypothetical protein
MRYLDLLLYQTEVDVNHFCKFISMLQEACCLHYSDQPADAVREIASSENCGKHANTLCRQNAEFYNVKASGTYHNNFSRD